MQLHSNIVIVFGPENSGAIEHSEELRRFYKCKRVMSIQRALAAPEDLESDTLIIAEESQRAAIKISGTPYKVIKAAEALAAIGV